tara:strand:- start:76 stop:438 length:363 start_codon:yes stop_codon:yes gene_type:complete
MFNSNKMMYIRAVGVLADDDYFDDSILFPVRNIRGFYRNTATLASMRINNPYNYIPTDVNDATGVLFEIASGQHTAFFKALADEIAFGETNVITLGDNVTGELFTGVTTVYGIASNVVDD